MTALIIIILIIIAISGRYFIEIILRLQRPTKFLLIAVSSNSFKTIYSLLLTMTIVIGYCNQKLCPTLHHDHALIVTIVVEETIADHH